MPGYLGDSLAILLPRTHVRGAVTVAEDIGVRAGQSRDGCQIFIEHLDPYAAVAPAADQRGIDLQGAAPATRTVL